MPNKQTNCTKIFNFLKNFYATCYVNRQTAQNKKFYLAILSIDLSKCTKIRRFPALFFVIIILQSIKCVTFIFWVFKFTISALETGAFIIIYRAFYFLHSLHILSLLYLYYSRLGSICQ